MQMKWGGCGKTRPHSLLHSNLPLFRSLYQSRDAAQNICAIHCCFDHFELMFFRDICLPGTEVGLFALSEHSAVQSRFLTLPVNNERVSCHRGAVVGAGGQGSCKSNNGSLPMPESQMYSHYNKMYPSAKKHMDFPVNHLQLFTDADCLNQFTSISHVTPGASRLQLSLSRKKYLIRWSL